jgi:hypothetical protein
MPALVAGIHDFFAASKTWMAVTSTAMTTFLARLDYCSNLMFTDLTTALHRCTSDAIRAASSSPVLPLARNADLVSGGAWWLGRVLRSCQR